MIINAVVYDEECLPNCFTFYAIDLNSETEWYFEISEFRNDGVAFWHFLNFLAANDWYMIGFNNVGYDYNLIHAFYAEPVMFTAANFYAINQRIIGSYDRFGTTVKPEDRYIRQIDLYKIHHFDNKAKSTSLKALQVAMRSENVMESSVPFGVPVRLDQMPELIEYNRHDVVETKRFALISMPMIEFRLKLQAKMTGDVLNFSDSKIGKQTLEQRLGPEVCYQWVNGKRVPRQSVRDVVRLSDCIFPYIHFREPEFNRILNWLMVQEVREVKGTFENLNCTINGFTFHFGVGGIHGSVERQKFASDDQWVIIDDDVGGYYPSLAIANKMHPEHLGEKFVIEFKAIKDERALHAKGTPENNALKLAGNSVFGDSGNPYSVFFDIKFLLTTTVNGQLLICMLAEWLMTVPTLTLIQINTDGLTYRVHRSMEWMVEEIRAAWMKYTMLDLEQARYSRMWVRDVNNYIGEFEGGAKRKLKGAYWTPTKHPDDIQNTSPTGWYKNYSNDITAKAAVEFMTNGTDIETFIRAWTDPFDFMLREKLDSRFRLYIGDKSQQKVTRYYVAIKGEAMRKIMPSTHPHRVGQYKAARGVSDEMYDGWHGVAGNVWNVEIHTKNKSTYEPERVTNMNAGMMVVECNHVNRFEWANVNYDWYINEARKLVI